MNTKKDNKLMVYALLIIIVILLILMIILLLRNNSTESNYTSNNNSSNLVNDEAPIDNEDNNIQDDNTQNTTQSNNYITKEKALSIALKNASLNQSDIYDINVELDYKYNQTVYEVDFNYKNYDYEYYIDATSGKILHSFKERD